MKLKEIFQKYDEYSFKFIQPGGNAGDYLIYAGAKKLANEVGIPYETMFFPALRYRIFYRAKFGTDDIIYLHGGGGYSSWYSWAAKLLRMIVTRHPKNLVIVGPSTTSLELEYLEKVLPRDNGNIIFFAREMTTYNFIKNNFYSKTYHDHDTALLLSQEDQFFKKFTGNISIENKYSLLVVRRDLESVPLPKKLRDRINDYDLIYHPYSFSNIRIIGNLYAHLRTSWCKWARIHLKASKITTNHLHSAILGVLAGKDVKLFQNSYHKNRSVWEYSLKDRGVEWVGD